MWKNCSRLEEKRLLFYCILLFCNAQTLIYWKIWGSAFKKKVLFIFIQYYSRCFLQHDILKQKRMDFSTINHCYIFLFLHFFIFYSNLFKSEIFYSNFLIKHYSNVIAGEDLMVTPPESAIYVPLNLQLIIC